MIYKKSIYGYLDHQYIYIFYIPKYIDHIYLALVHGSWLTVP